jgi:hypothetical protein
MKLLGRAKFSTKDENPKGKVKFLKGGEFPRNFAPPPPGRAILLGISLPLGGEIVLVGGRNCTCRGAKFLRHRHISNIHAAALIQKVFVLYSYYIFAL